MCLCSMAVDGMVPSKTKDQLPQFVNVPYYQLWTILPLDGTKLYHLTNRH
jgi:hypothetical protein